ncbi:unnamed protein product [Diamesa serratosioi]
MENKVTNKSKRAKKVSPLRGIFVKRDRVNTLKAHNSYATKPKPKPKRDPVGSPIEKRLESRRQSRLDGESTDSDYDEAMFPEKFESMPRDWKISDMEELRKKTREERFIPAICRLSQQKSRLREMSIRLTPFYLQKVMRMRIPRPNLHTTAIEEDDEEDELSDEYSDSSYEGRSSDEDDENDLNKTSITFYDSPSPNASPTSPSIYFTPATPTTSFAPATPNTLITPATANTPGTPNTPPNANTPGSPNTPPTPYTPPLPYPTTPATQTTSATQDPATPPFTAPTLSPLAIPPLTPPPKERKSLDDIFEENYSTLMAVVPVIPLHFRKLVQKWLVKLVSMSDSDRNKKNRNQHIAFMLVQLQSLELTAPFIKDPPAGDLKELGRTNNTFFLKWLAEATKVSIEDKMRKTCTPLQIAQRLVCQEPSGFLEDQPVPNFGMIAYGSCFSTYGQ